MKKKYMIIIPGIFKREGFVKKIYKSNFANKKNVEIFRIDWLGNDILNVTLNELTKKINILQSRGYDVILIGTSAGASIARILFNYKKIGVKKLVTICGPIRDSRGIIFKIGKWLSPTWKTALKFSENIKKDKSVENILTILPYFDELVPLKLMEIEGANTIKLNTCEHLFSISIALAKYSREILDFVNKK